MTLIARRATLASILALAAGPNLARADPFPDTNRAAFLNACIKSSGGNEAGCVCMLTNIERAVSFHQYAIWETAKQIGEPVDAGVSAKIVGAVVACRK